MYCQESSGEGESDLGLQDMAAVEEAHPVRWGLQNGKARLPGVRKRWDQGNQVSPELPQCHQGKGITLKFLRERWVSVLLKMCFVLFCLSLRKGVDRCVVHIHV